MRQTDPLCLARGDLVCLGEHFAAEVAHVVGRVLKLDRGEQAFAKSVVPPLDEHGHAAIGKRHEQPRQQPIPRHIQRRHRTDHEQSKPHRSGEFKPVVDRQQQPKRRGGKRDDQRHAAQRHIAADFAAQLIEQLNDMRC